MPDRTIYVLINFQSLDKFKNKSMNEVLYMQILALYYLVTERKTIGHSKFQGKKNFIFHSHSNKIKSNFG